MALRVPGKRQETILDYGEPYALDAETEIRLYPAGHIFGSAQLWARRRGETLLYTGDFKLRPGQSAEACATPQADTVIMESTFGLPRYRFPPTAKVLGDILHFCRDTLDDGEIPVLLGYSLGKSQELLKSLSEAAFPIMLHPQTVKMTRVYESLGIAFPAYREFAAEAVSGHVVICPPQANASAWLRRIRPRRTAVITGWAIDPATVFRYQCDAAFPLSDHADYDDLLEFVRRVNPRRVYTTHGFAREFAQTLRTRGIDAWALGGDNQMEFLSPVPEEAPPSQQEQGEPPSAVAEPHTLRAFSGAAERIRAVPGKLAKTAILRSYLSQLDEEALAPAVIFFTGRPFPASVNLPLQLGWSLIRRAVLAVAGANEGDFRSAYSRFSDSGDTAEALLAGKTSPVPLPLTELSAWFSALTAEPGPLAKVERLEALLRRLDSLEAKYLIKIVTGDLRIGLKEGLVEETLAQVTGSPLEAVREANLLTGNLDAVARAALRGQLEKLQLTLFHPLQPMLASPEPDAAAIVARLGVPVWIEEKYDGIRCQVHKQGTGALARVEFYSRELKRITPQFPEVAAAVAALPSDWVADGELLAWRGGRALPYAELQKRLGRTGGADFFLGEEIPVSLMLYDLLWLDGVSLLKRSLRERRQALDRLALPEGGLVRREPVAWAADAVAVDAAFLRARQRGNEGLMVKDPESLYTPGRRGFSWVKFKKAYATLDVVVVGVEKGHGKRREVLSDYTFAVRDEARAGRLLTVGKAYTGLTDAEIAEMTEWFLGHTREIHGRYRTVEPEIVIEVAFNNIQPSDRHSSGYALRFPRIVRLRRDKSPAEIDTLETCRRLASAQGEAGA